MMKKFYEMLFLKILIALSVIYSATVSADVYVDLSQADEISISNNTSEQDYTFKIEEPVLTNTPVNIAAKIRSGSVDNQNLPFNNEVIIAANETDIEPALIHAVITVESKLARFPFHWQR